MADCCSVKQRSEAPPTMTCPVSGKRSKQVALLTVKSLVRHLPFGMPTTQFYFCEDPECDVVYFPLDPAGPAFRRGDLLVRVGVKEKDDPVLVCCCFGVTRGEIQEEVLRTGRSAAPERIKAEVKAGNCACEVKNPSGKCCLGTVIGAVQHAMRALPSSSKQPSVPVDSEDE